MGKHVKVAFRAGLSLGCPFPIFALPNPSLQYALLRQRILKAQLNFGHPRLSRLLLLLLLLQHLLVNSNATVEFLIGRHSPH